VKSVERIKGIEMLKIHCLMHLRKQETDQEISCVKRKKN